MISIFFYFVFQYKQIQTLQGFNKLFVLVRDFQMTSSADTVGFITYM